MTIVEIIEQYERGELTRHEALSALVAYHRLTERGADDTLDSGSANVAAAYAQVFAATEVTYLELLFRLS